MNPGKKKEYNRLYYQTRKAGLKWPRTRRGNGNSGFIPPDQGIVEWEDRMQKVIERENEHPISI